MSANEQRVNGRGSYPRRAQCEPNAKRTVLEVSKFTANRVNAVFHNFGKRFAWKGNRASAFKAMASNPPLRNHYASYVAETEQKLRLTSLKPRLLRAIITLRRSPCPTSCALASVAGHPLPEDLRIIDSMDDQYAIEKNNATMTPSSGRTSRTT